ncbi:TPA: Dabb family protein, partial [Clostridium perfringens]|nr:Dabb family protein [Clostridium perfringens]
TPLGVLHKNLGTSMPSSSNSTFNSLEDLDSYQKNPDHVKAGSFVKKVASSRVVVDYEM